MVFNYSYVSVSPGVDRVYFRQSHLECTVCPTVAHPQSTMCVNVGGPLGFTYVDLSATEGSQADYRLCMESPVSSTPVDLFFVTLRLIDVALDVSTVRAAPAQAIAITWTGSTLVAGDLVYFTSSGACASSQNSVASQNSRQAQVTTSGAPVAIDLTGAALNLAAWGLCVVSPTVGVLDYRLFHPALFIADVTTGPKYVSAVLGQKVAITSAVSIPAGNVVWFSADTPCTSPAIAAGTGISPTTTSVAAFTGSGEYSFDFRFAQSFGVPWALCTGPAGSAAGGQAFDNSDAAVVLSDLAVAPPLVTQGARAVNITYSDGDERALKDSVCVHFDSRRKR